MDSLDFPNQEGFLLIKVPKWVADVWRESPLGLTLGTFTENFKELNLSRPSLGPSDFSLETKPVDNLFIMEDSDILEDNNEVRIVTGAVREIITMLPAVNPKYRMITRKKIMENRSSRLCTALVDDKKSKRPPLFYESNPNHVFKYFHPETAFTDSDNRSPSDTSKVSSSSSRGGEREILSQDEIKRYIFGIFAESDVDALTLKSLVTKIGQGESRVRKALDDICVQKGSGVNKHKWSIKVQYGGKRAQNEDGVYVSQRPAKQQRIS